ncbi:MAG: AAA family ATPase [Proteobacteria bacterium]|nr:AAA family ATPase [Pseudomonadota bacterium]
MINIAELALKDVRCFAKEQSVHLAPLTFLVGENSTGKSTVLGCYHALCRILENNKFEKNLSHLFNTAPYEMGAFSDIVRNRQKSFTLTAQLQEIHRKISFEFIDRGLGFFVNKIHIFLGNKKQIILHSNYERFNTYPSLFFNTSSSGISEIKTDNNIYHVYSNAPLHTFMNFRLYAMHNVEPFLPPEFKTQELVECMTLFHFGIFSFLPQHTMKDIINIAPIRSKPKRTYNPLNEGYKLAGEDIPIYLMRIKLSTRKEEKKIRTALKEFGKVSGLFDKIEVKSFSKKINEPFQLQVTLHGKNVNLLDTGYGISQILPILVKIFSNEAPSTMLLQQPEIHLHPRGQAELSSLLISAVAEKKQQFIIETHSDYMIDRARIEIRKGKIKPEDVSLVYFEIKNKQAITYNIGLDAQGNLTNVPKGYRKFFVRECDTLLGFDE